MTADPEYRIVVGGVNGYVAQVRGGWWPFWRDVGMSRSTPERAEDEAREHANPTPRPLPPRGTVVKALGSLRKLG